MITFGGINSGLDTNAIIKALVQVERAPIARLEGVQRNLAKQQESLSTIDSKLKELAASLSSFKAAGGFPIMQATTSNDNSVAVAAGSGAIAGDYEIVVEQLAKETRVYSDGFPSPSEPLSCGTGELTIKVGGDDAVSFAIDADTSLEGLVSRINSANVRASASVFYDGNVYRLRVSGADTGAENAVSFGETGIALGVATAANAVQEAQDALLFIDGMAARSSNNLVTTVLPGVSLRLNGITDAGSPTRVRVSPDGEKTAETILSIVDAYNAAVDAVSTQMTAVPGGTRSPMAGSSALRSLQNDISRAASFAVDGLDGGIRSLSQLGISTQRNGTLRLDRAILDRVIEDDPNAIARVFAGDAAGGVVGVAERLATVVESYTDFADGRLGRVSKSIGDRTRDIGRDIARMELHLDAYERRLTSEFAAMEQLMGALAMQNDTIAQFGIYGY